MVSIIHKNEEEGAILAFLTSQLEVEWACENFSDADAVVLPMHGKLSHVEQNLVFKSYPGKRKIIFCTNIAETSLTIKEVKYVVDSGLAKESRFVPSSGLNVLKVNWISQSSANQRAGRAGRTGAGRCYRLYSESDFSMMEVHQEPEIRKVHLGTAVLRILALGIRNVQNFEFVDAPNPEAINMAVKNLEQLGAVEYKCDGFELTDTGRYLVKLGIEPRLGKIMLDCFGSGLKKEGVVLAAVMANSSSIFCRVGTDEEKYKADRLKRLEKHKLQMKVISELGNNLLRRFCGKSGQNQQKIISLLQEEFRDDRVTVEVDFRNNEVVLFAKEQDIEKVFGIVNNALECEARMLRNECLEKSLFSGKPGDCSLALFGSGAEIKHLELEKRYLTVSSDETKWGKFTFLNPEYAEYAVSKLNGMEFHGSPLKVVPVAAAEEKLVHALLLLREKKPLDIRLRGCNLPPNLMKEILKKFGADLEGFKRETYKEYKEDPDATLLEWRKGKENVKICPSCGFTIEKADGCNHVESLIA
ncbi:hypothetical protein E2562_022904 [Oryza meyeriana var. granulata]|uniref:Helicase C-terminal domain-containing protein n=1 Tax=Oryza meyeriana var. granulata TaxID=110450 RepID=A0A6G1D7E3_9ORYZ|nr:hypothetical protein E2562_022904 [Oryza meyeriana var. granulata]